MLPEKKKKKKSDKSLRNTPTHYMIFIFTIRVKYMLNKGCYLKL